MPFPNCHAPPEVLSAVEFLDEECMRLVTQHLPGVTDPLGPEGRGDGTPWPFYMLLETHGSDARHDAEKLEAFLEVRTQSAALFLLLLFRHCCRRRCCCCCCCNACLDILPFLLLVCELWVLGYGKTFSSFLYTALLLLLLLSATCTTLCCCC